MSGEERRRFVRYDVNAWVEVGIGRREHLCASEDLGAGGCRITLPVALEKGCEVEIRLSSDRTDVVASGTAKVAWATRGLPSRVGLAFSNELSEQAIPFLHALLGAVSIRTRGA